eukprot:6898834-Lingulodinium_polyedra.AAC.1
MCWRGCVAHRTGSNCESWRGVRPGQLPGWPATWSASWPAAGPPRLRPYTGQSCEFQPHEKQD